MWVLYVSFWYTGRPRTFGYVAMGSAVLFILKFRLLVYFAGSGVSKVQVVFPGYSVKLLCFVHAKVYICLVVCVSLLHSYLCRCDSDVI